MPRSRRLRVNQVDPRVIPDRQMEFTAAELWSRVLASAKTEVPEQSYRTWLAGSEAVGLSEQELIVEAPSDFHVEWVEDKYGSLLSDLVKKTLGRPLSLTFRCSATVPPARVPETTPRAEAEGSAQHDSSRPSRGEPPLGGDSWRGTNLNERYTFDRFVVGNNNQLAAAAGHAVAERPARIYNPLFLYGGVGLGKTHLMHALGHAILERQPTARVSYVTTERFMNELVNAIQHGTTPAFRRRFREIDLLLVDDVHFLAKKESTQEEFFHTFNALYDAGKQIVLTSDRPPKELPGLEERLVSRFEWGLVADITPPDYETRVAILQKKANDDGLVIDVETIDFIARSCTSSVRELEGATIKLLAYSSLRNEEITIELARAALQGVLRGRNDPERASLTAERIRDEVARSWNVRPDGLISKRRTQEVTVPRQVAMYLIKEMLDESLVRIGQLFGGRDHSTVIHSIRKIRTQMEEDPAFASRVELIRERLNIHP
ncbi:MAG: chromosomal replication initiator protein DnaA [Gemmatimonadetes bacterium]|nr:chromosomal replication initiator protein DnaA [Gemmatimonadota bacterium]